MSLTRRRFLSISAAFATGPGHADAQSWQGRAFGGDIRITIRGPRDIAGPALAEARALIDDAEARFSLYDPGSDLVRLNTMGTIRPTPRFHALMQAADHVHRVTGGLFDPTVQPLWRALAEARDPAQALAAIGWGRVVFDATRVTLAPGQALTFNGIAQGFATDLVSDAFAARGLSDTLVNIGEYRGTGGPWRLGLDDPVHGALGTRTLTTGAIATSSPGAMPLATGSHILHPDARPRWSTVSVEAETATLADGLSTALALATRDQIEPMRALAGVRRITLVDFDGDLSTIRAFPRPGVAGGI